MTAKQTCPGARGRNCIPAGLIIAAPGRLAAVGLPGGPRPAGKGVSRGRSHLAPSPDGPGRPGTGPCGRYAAPGTRTGGRA